MATYSNLSNGSQGADVKKMQQALIDAGYNVGSSGADGIFGRNTETAVRQYQQDNGLAVDGIAGNNTLTSLYSGGSGATAGTNVDTSTSPTTGNELPDYSKYSYDPSANTAYQDALAALQAAKNELPVYEGSYDTKLDDLYDQIVNREDFSYDLNNDPVYNQYKDQYINQGSLAMRDSMGQAAALTGGYGSSYGQSVGQQQYDAYLRQLNEVVPELYGMAREQYDAEGDELYRQYGLMADLRDDEYGRYQDSLDRYYQNIDMLKENADDAYDRDYENWYNSYQMGINADNTAYDRMQDNYDRLSALISSTGYSPSSAELEAAGMSEAQAKAYADYYKEQKALTGSSGGSSGGSSRGSSRSSSGGSSSSNKTQTETNTSSGSGDKKSNPYADFTQSDWKAYFDSLNKNSGRDAAIYQYNSLSNQGLIPAAYLSICYSAASRLFDPPAWGKNSGII